ncbi:antihemorrhagic factor cHLP-B-like [Salarias fasciatus]|uniref:antihemorrhagic factor cHLP-B-like n=1 Tax=Salarias fasciatus TaxID=181472 RepID=UPI0011767D85|nr:antihemorrhagic factor cHLP-B-like [Salarias fasciatus]
MTAFLLLTALAVAPMLCASQDPVTCSVDRFPDAAKMAVRHINEQQDHGYKFRLMETKSSRMELADGGCTIQLQLDLGETECSFISTKPAEDCEYRGKASWAVAANCTVLLSVKGADAKVAKYGCSMRKEPASAEEMMLICPDCPKLLLLSDEAGIRGVLAGVSQFNQNTSNQHLYGLQDVGRISLGYVMTMGMMYYSEFVLKETNCPRGTRIVPEACDALCTDRAHHAFCHLSYATRDNQVLSLSCEVFPPKNFTPLGPGEQEPSCPSPRRSAGSGYVFACPGAEPNADPTMHPVCPYPVPEVLQVQS